MRILSVITNEYGSSFYRLAMPGKAMRMAGYPALQIRDSAMPANVVELCDVVQISRVSRMAPEIIAHMRTLQDKGLKVVIDYDDDLLHLPDHNGARATVDPDAVIEVVKAADAITVTNDALAAVFRPYAKRVAVIPNYVDPQMWPTPSFSRKEKLTIGLVGGPSHVKDWELIREPIQRIRREFAGVQFLVAGYFPDYLKDIATEHVAWQNILDYQATVRRIDIGLAPLLDDEFNKCKSPIKAYEYAQAGAAVVGSPTQYRTVLQGRGIVVRTQDEWYNGIATYITDENKRLKDAKALHTYVTKSLDVRKHAHEIYQTYKKLFKE